MKLAALILAVLAPFAASGAPPITSAAYTSDGRSVLLGSQAGLELRTWPKLTPSRRLETKLTNIHDMAFSPSGDILAVAGGEPGDSGGIELFRWPDGELIRLVMPHTDIVHALSWRPDGRALVTAGADGAVLVQDVESGEVSVRLAGHSRAVLAAAWLSDQCTLLTGGADNTIRVWGNRPTPTVSVPADPPPGMMLVSLRILDNHTGAVQGLAVRPDRDAASLPMVASIGADSTLRLWQPTIGRLVRIARLESEPLAVAWTGDSALVAAACVDGRVRLVDPETAEIVAELSGIGGWAYTLVTAPDARSFLVAGADGQLVRVVPPTINPR